MPSVWFWSAAQRYSITSSARASRLDGNSDAEFAGGLEIERQLELRRLLDRQITRISALQNLVHNRRHAAEELAIVRRVRHQPARQDMLVEGEHGG
jgi:hypothetical protein